MKIVKHAKAVALGRMKSVRPGGAGPAPVSEAAVNRAENFLARSKPEFIATVQQAKKSLAKNETGPLAGRLRDRSNLR